MLKQAVAEKNRRNHPELTPEDDAAILQGALYALGLTEIEKLAVHLPRLTPEGQQVLSGPASLRLKVADLLNEVKPGSTGGGNLVKEGAVGGELPPESGALLQPDESARGEKQYRPEDIEGDVDRVVKIVPAKPEASRRIADARQWAKENLQGRELPNRETGIVAVPSDDSIGKMLAGGKPYPGERSAAMYSLPELFAEAARTTRHADDGSDRQVAQVHEFHAPFEYQGQVYRVRMLAKEFTPATKWPNKLHSYRIEDVVVEKETPAGTRAIAGGETTTRSTPSAGKMTLRQLFNDFKPKGDVKPLLQGDEDQKPRYDVREEGGRLVVANAVTGKAHDAANSIYSGDNTPAERARLESNARALNDTQREPRPDTSDPQPGTLPAVEKALAKADQHALANGETPTHTPGLVRQLIGNSGTDLMEKAGGALKTVSDRVHQYYDRVQEMVGQFYKPVAAVVHGANRKELTAALDQVAEYNLAWQTREYARMQMAKLEKTRADETGRFEVVARLNKGAAGKASARADVEAAEVSGWDGGQGAGSDPLGRTVVTKVAVEPGDPRGTGSGGSPARQSVRCGEEPGAADQAGIRI